MATKSKKTPILFLLLTAILIGGAGWYFLQSDLVETDEEVPEDLLALAERRDLESTLLLSGEVIPAFQVDVKPEVGGKVQKIYFKTGDHVRRGDLLAVIDDTDLMTEKEAALTEIAGAELNVDKNRGNYDRAKALFDEKLISKEVFANLEADLRISENSLLKAESRLQSVEDRLDKTRIVAPADGTILNLPVNEGQVVSAAASVNSGTLLMTFADLSRLLIDTHVNQMDVSKVQAGQRISVKIQGGDENPINAIIEFVAPLATVKNNIKGFQVEAEILENQGRLKPGMSVSMSVPVAEAENAVSVPIAAVFSENDEKVVYVRSKRSGQAADRRKVTVGLSNLSFAEITSGLDEGEEILLINPRLLNSNS
ncbi:MAG: efflux RND transporter periplasmic adaptor subunit [Chthoniobacterales bacterium]